MAPNKPWTKFTKRKSGRTLTKCRQTNTGQKAPTAYRDDRLRKLRQFTTRQKAKTQHQDPHQWNCAELAQNERHQSNNCMKGTDHNRTTGTNLTEGMKSTQLMLWRQTLTIYREEWHQPPRWDDRHQPYTGTTGADLTHRPQPPNLYRDKKIHAKTGRQPHTKEDTDLKEY